MGSLHEHNPSLWIATTEPGAFGPLTGDRRADVVVVGAGIAGLTTARMLVDEGASVIVVDAGPISAGATGYTTAKVTSLHGLAYTRIADAFDEDRARLYGEANEAAIAEVARLVGSDGIDCDFERRTHIVYTTDDAMVDAVTAEAELAARLGLPAALSDAPELPLLVRAAVAFTDQAQFHPRAYCLGLADAVVSGGGSVFAHTRVRSIDSGTGPSGGPERVVTTDRGELRAEAVVVATHLPINEMGAYFARCEPMRSYAMAVTVDGPVPEAMYLSVDSPTRSLRTAGDHLIVGGEGHRVGEAHDTGEHYRNLEQWAHDHLPVTGVAHRWSAQDWSAADGVPYIGRMAGADDGVFVATAFQKWGMTHGTVAAMIIRDLVADRENPWLEVYDATRIAPRQSLKGVVSENLATVKHLFGDRLGTGDRATIEELAPGDGAVARVDGHEVAAFRADDGSLSAVSAVCTHLGCLVTFNPAERSWDCPCHGSRFTIDGSVLEGPAVDDLAEVALDLPAPPASGSSAPSSAPGSD